MKDIINNDNNNNNDKALILNQKCSFCGEDVTGKILIFKSKENPSLCICPKCVYLYYTVLDVYGLIPEYAQIASASSQKTEKLLKAEKVPTPKEIKRALDKYIIEQNKAKMVLSVAVYNHYKRIKNVLLKNDSDIKKSNVILVGPTGCGKTLLVQTLAKFLNVPLAIADATNLTKKGYVGSDVETVLARLIEVSDYDVEYAQNGIVYIDEIDKISRKGRKEGLVDPSGEGVQQDLLKIIEGNVVDVEVDGDTFQIDTTNILFICGGAFDGIEDIVENRTIPATIGFGAQVRTKEEREDKNSIYANVTQKDLVKYGILPELIGRLPIIATLMPLSEAALRDVIKKPKDSILKQYAKLLKMDGVSLVVEEDAIEEIAKEAIERGTGARAIRSIFEEAMLETMFEIPSKKTVKKCIITKEVIANHKKAKLEYEGKK